jgi:hypothetical protein
MIEIPALVTSAWTALQPFLPVIATKAAEEIGKTAVAKLWTAIEKKFDTKAAAKEALEDLLKNPKDEDTHVVFRVQLKKLLEEDSSFASDLASLLESAGSDYKAQVIGGGAIAQGTNAKAVGAGGILIEGDVRGNGVTIGNHNTTNDGKKK